MLGPAAATARAQGPESAEDREPPGPEAALPAAVPALPAERSAPTRPADRPEPASLPEPALPLELDRTEQASLPEPALPSELDRAEPALPPELDRPRPALPAELDRPEQASPPEPALPPEPASLPKPTPRPEQASLPKQASPNGGAPRAAEPVPADRATPADTDPRLGPDGGDETTLVGPLAPAVPSAPSLAVPRGRSDLVDEVVAAPYTTAPQLAVGELLARIEAAVRGLHHDLRSGDGTAPEPYDASPPEQNAQLEPLTQPVGLLEPTLPEALGDLTSAPDLAEGLIPASADSELGRALTGSGEVKRATAYSPVGTRQTPSVPGWSVAAAPRRVARAGGAAEIYATTAPAPRAAREQSGPSPAPERNRPAGATGAPSGSAAPGTGNFGASVAALFVLAALALAGLSMRLAPSPPCWRPVIVVAPLERPG